MKKSGTKALGAILGLGAAALLLVGAAQAAPAPTPAPEPPEPPTPPTPPRVEPAAPERFELPDPNGGDGFDPEDRESILDDNFELRDRSFEGDGDAAVPAEEPAAPPKAAPRRTQKGGASKTPSAPSAAPARGEVLSPIEQSARRVATTFYNQAVSSGHDSATAAAFALQTYLNNDGSSPSFIALYQRMIGVPPTGRPDAATRGRILEMSR